MPDREAVINGFEQCLKDGDGNVCSQCPYNKYHRTGFEDGCLGRLMRDALAIVRGNVTTFIKEPDRYEHYRCGACGYVAGVVARMHKYCPNCGRKVDGIV